MVTGENGWTPRQIKELIEQAVCAERRLRDALRAEDRERFETYKHHAAKALELQAREYERRLDILNHAHEEAKRVLGTYITREMYERAHGEVVEWQRKADVEKVDTNNRIKSVELGLVNLPGGIKSLELGLAAQSGHQVGARMTVTTIITLIAVGIAAVGGLVGVLSYLSK